MGDFPCEDGGRYAALGLAGSTTGTVVTASGTLHTKGAWAELIASELLFAVLENSAAFTRLLDIGVGAAGSEVVVVPDIIGAYPRANQCHFNACRFACDIPAGSRVAVRMQSSVASSTLAVVVHLLAQGFLPPIPLGRVTAYGANAATSAGTTIDPGAAANTKGAWVELAASTANRLRRLTLLFTGRVNTAFSTQRFYMDVGVGAAGSEVVLVPDLPLHTGITSDDLNQPVYAYLPVDVPAGTRLAARSQCNGTDATDRLLDVVAYGMD